MRISLAHLLFWLSVTGLLSSAVFAKLTTSAPWPTWSGPPSLNYGIAPTATFPGVVNFSLPDSGAAMSSVLAFDETGDMYTAFAQISSSGGGGYSFVRFSPERDRLAWRVDTPLYGTPIIGSDTVLICWMTGYKETQAEVRMGIDRETGHILYNITEVLGPVPSYFCAMRTDGVVFYQQNTTHIQVLSSRTGAHLSAVPCAIGHPWSLWPDASGRVFAFCNDTGTSVFTAFNNSGNCTSSSYCAIERLYEVPDLAPGAGGIGDLYSFSQDWSDPESERLIYAYTRTDVKPQEAYVVSRASATGDLVWRLPIPTICGDGATYSGTSRIAVDSLYSPDGGGSGTLYVLCGMAYPSSTQVLSAVSRDGVPMWNFSSSPLQQGGSNQYGASIAADGSVFVQEGRIGAVIQLDGHTGQLLSVTESLPAYGEGGYTGPVFPYGQGQGFARRALLTDTGSKYYVKDIVVQEVGALLPPTQARDGQV